MKSGKTKTKKAAKPVKKTGLAKKMPKRQVRKIVINKEKAKEEPKVFVLSLALRQAALKVMAMFLILALNWTGLTAIGETLAYFNDTEQVVDNSYTAATLDFSLQAGDWTPPGRADKLLPGEPVARTVDIINDGILGFQYTVSTTQTGGDNYFCNALQLQAQQGTSTIYTGPLMNFLSTSTLFSTSNSSWLFTVSLPASTSADIEGQVCQFKFIFYGWQEDLPPNQGFNDTEEIDNTIKGGLWGEKLLINKVYYDVDNAHGTEPANEWVELYNPTDKDIDVANWQICDNYDCLNITQATSIPALGLAVLSNSTTTWNYWDIPTTAPKIYEFNAGPLMLGNTADMLILKRPNGKITDQMNWGTPTSSWPNYNANIWNPGATDVAEGHMLGRVPTGYDTDQPSDFKDLGLPQVQVIIPNGGETWSIGKTYTLMWQATNPNGTDTDLSIDIWYSNDSGATWANVTSSTENDGAYDWRVPLYLDGNYLVVSTHARIKVVAFGPENFMVQNWDMSDNDFCPPVEYELLTPEEQEQLKILLAEGIVSKEMVEGAEGVDLGLGPVLPLPPAELSPALDSLDSALDSTTSLDQGTTTTTTESTTTPPTETPDILFETATSTAESTPVVIENTEPEPQATADENPVAEPEPLVLEEPTVTLPEAPTLPDNNSEAGNSNSSEATAGTDNPAPQTTGTE
ncbi:MAG: lamin tail domain-containing protein [Candidatus Pacebacteria bacterium]|nr:lamin tail domain-containing protein [Candidatus Paceibacterota bacterium]